MIAFPSVPQNPWEDLINEMKNHMNIFCLVTFDY